MKWVGIASLVFSVCLVGCNSGEKSLGSNVRRGQVVRSPAFDAASPACLKCHAQMAQRKWAHYPAVEALCEICHKAGSGHLASGDKRDVSSSGSQELCYQCHTRVGTQGEAHPVLASDDSCVYCHDPHGSDRRFFLPWETHEVCQQCHDVAPEDSKSSHSVIRAAGKACLHCHLPHSSEHKPLLVSERKNLCLSCHDQEIVVPRQQGDPRKIANIKKLVEMPVVHAPAKAENGCTQCHQPHASKFDRLFTRNFPLSDRNEHRAGGNGVPGTYDLCLSCHPNVLNKKITGPETRFRKDALGWVFSGKIVRKNLHWFHVVDAGRDPDKENGVSCRVCHDPHGTTQQRLIRSTWQFSPRRVKKIEFKATPMGGECGGACHTKRTYERLD